MINKVLIEKLFDVTINNNYISKKEVYDNILLKLFKRCDENKVQRYKTFGNDFLKIKYENDQYKITDIITFLNNFMYLPIHYTYLKELNLVNDNFTCIRKKFEYQCGYYLYKEFKLNHNNYNIYYQHQILKYKIDYVINPKNTNIYIGIEIDEIQHLYTDEFERTTTIELVDIPLIRIKVHKLKNYNDVTEKFMKTYIIEIYDKINYEFNKQKIFDENILVCEANQNSIETDFAKITGMSIINNEDFIIPGDFIIKYIEYNDFISNFITNCVLDKLDINEDYIKISKKDYINKFVLGQEQAQNIYNITAKDRRKEFYLFNTRGMMLAIMNSQTKKAKEVKQKIVKMYEITRKLLQNKIIQKENQEKEKYIQIKYILEKLTEYKYDNKIQAKNNKLQEKIDILKKSDNGLLISENNKLKDTINSLQKKNFIIENKTLQENIIKLNETINILENDNYKLKTSNIELNEKLNNNVNDIQKQSNETELYIKQEFKNRYNLIVTNEFTIPCDIIVDFVQYKHKQNTFITNCVINKVDNKYFIKLNKIEYVKYITKFENTNLYKVKSGDSRPYYYLFNYDGVLHSIINCNTPTAIKIKKDIIGLNQINKIKNDTLTNNNMTIKNDDLKRENEKLKNDYKKLKKYIPIVKNTIDFIDNFDKFNDCLTYVLKTCPNKLLYKLQNLDIPEDFFNILVKLFDNELQYNLYIDELTDYLEIEQAKNLFKNINQMNITEKHLVKFDNANTFKTYIQEDKHLQKRFNKYVLLYNKNSRKHHILFSKYGFIEICQHTKYKIAIKTKEWFKDTYNCLLQIVGNNSEYYNTKS